MAQSKLTIDEETARLIHAIAQAEDATPAEVLQDAVLRDLLRRRIAKPLGK